MESEYKMRICKKCDNIKIVTLFASTKNKKSKNQTYSHTCKECEKSKRQLYFKEYHKIHYTTKKKKT